MHMVHILQPGKTSFAKLILQTRKHQLQTNICFKAGKTAFLQTRQASAACFMRVASSCIKPLQVHFVKHNS